MCLPVLMVLLQYEIGRALGEVTILSKMTTLDTYQSLELQTAPSFASLGRPNICVSSTASVYQVIVACYVCLLSLC